MNKELLEDSETSKLSSDEFIVEAICGKRVKNN